MVPRVAAGTAAPILQEHRHDPDGQKRERPLAEDHGDRVEADPQPPAGRHLEGLGTPLRHPPDEGEGQHDDAPRHRLVEPGREEREAGEAGEGHEPVDPTPARIRLHHQQRQEPDRGGEPCVGRPDEIGTCASGQIEPECRQAQRHGEVIGGEFVAEARRDPDRATNRGLRSPEAPSQAPRDKTAGDGRVHQPGLAPSRHDGESDRSGRQAERRIQPLGAGQALDQQQEGQPGQEERPGRIPLGEDRDDREGDHRVPRRPPEHGEPFVAKEPRRAPLDAPEDQRQETREHAERADVSLSAAPKLEYREVGRRDARDDRGIGPPRPAIEDRRRDEGRGQDQQRPKTASAIAVEAHRGSGQRRARTPQAARTTPISCSGSPKISREASLPPGPSERDQQHSVGRRGESERTEQDGHRPRADRRQRQSRRTSRERAASVKPIWIEAVFGVEYSPTRGRPRPTERLTVMQAEIRMAR